MENNKLIEKLLQTLQEDLLSNNIDIDYSFNKYKSNRNLIAASLYYKFLCEVLKIEFS